MTRANVDDAYVKLPAGRAKAKPIPAEWRGVIRRVDLPRGVNKVALTFDLCEQPHEKAGYESAIVDYLRATQTKATFFGGGKWIENHEQRSRQIIADSLFEMGNHTWEHRNLRRLSGDALRDEIGGAQLAYAKVHRTLLANQCISPDRPSRVNGIESIPGQPWLFRFPFGACNPRSLAAVAEAGLLAIQWDVSSGDPLRSLSPARMADAVVRSVRSGSIVLFHANGRGWSTAQALRLIIPRLREKYELVTVTELLNTEGAQPDIKQTCYDSRPGDTEHYDTFAERLEATYRRFKQEYEQRNPPAPAAPMEASPPVLKGPPVPAVRKKEQDNREPADSKNSIYR